MNCKKCGFLLKAEDQFCKNCGSPVNVSSVQPVAPMNNVDIQPVAPMNSVDVQPVAPTNNVDVQPVAPTNNVDVQPVAPMNSVDVQPVAPMNNVDVQPVAPTNNVDVQPVAPTNNIDVQPVAPMNSVDVQPVAPMNNVDVQPTMPMNNVGVQPTMPMNNVGVQPTMPMNNVGVQPAMPINNINQVKKSKKSGIIIAVVVAILVLGLSVMFIPKFLNDSSSDENNTKAVTASTYKVKYSGFTFNVPDNMIYDVSEILKLGDEEETWVVEMMVVDLNYTQLKNNKSMLQSHFQKNGYETKPATLKTISNNEYLALEMQYNGTNFIGAYSKLNSMKAVWLIAYTQDNDINYEILSNISSIIKTATYEETSNSMATSPIPNLNVDVISQYGK